MPTATDRDFLDTPTGRRGTGNLDGIVGALARWGHDAAMVTVRRGARLTRAS